jgi:hypothetical protein
MRRTTIFLGLALSAGAVALVALHYSRGTGPQHAHTDEPTRSQTGQTQETAPTSIASPPLLETPSDTRVVHESTTRTAVFVGENTPDAERERERAARDVQVYSLLLEHLSLTPREKDALLALLIEIQVASVIGYENDGTAVRYSRDRPPTAHERSARIASIIGDPKLQQFLALERNLAAYAEVEKVRSLLQTNGVPLTDAQRDGLFKVVTEVRERYEMPPSDAKSVSIESLEHTITQIEEYDRHVMESAPSVLSPKQVVYLSEQYQYESYERARALESQKKQQADQPIEEVFFPVW